MMIRDLLDSLNRLEPPQLWGEVVRRASAPTPEPPPHRTRRLVAAAVGLLIGTFGVLVVIRAFGLAGTPAQPRDTLGASQIAFAGGATGGPQIFTMLGDGSQRMALTSPGPASPASPYPAWEPAWSPDGSLLAFRGYWGDGEFSDLFIMNADGTRVRQLTTRMNGSDPTWAPDGSRIAFAGYDGLYVTNIDGTGLQPVTAGGTEYADPSWSPDGRRIAYSRVVGDMPEVFVVNVDGSDEQQLTDLPGGAGQPAWSPDGLHIVFQGDSLKTPSLFSMDPSGDGLVAVTHCEVPSCTGDSFPTWLPDGSTIGFVRNLNIFTVRLDGTDVRQVTSDGAGYDRPSWRPVMAVAN